MGTVAYMSPEQARGELLDARTDLFSFGAVPYEMATGKQAFSGPSSAAIFHAILGQAPASPVSLNPQLPPELERIVNKALEKDRELRYQHAADILTDLKRLKRDTDSARAGVAPGSRPAPAALKGRATQRWPLALVGLLALIAASGLVWFLTHRAPPPKPPAELSQKRLTFNSSENAIESGAISPDGQYLAYSDRAGIHVKLLSSGEERLIPRPAGVPAGASWIVGSWFPDGTQLLANAYEPGGHQSMWAVSVLGQSPRELRDGARAWEVSPDGSRTAFTPGVASGEPAKSGRWAAGQTTRKRSLRSEKTNGLPTFTGRRTDSAWPTLGCSALRRPGSRSRSKPAT
jgi:serine/threonine protein kinase